MSPKMIADRCQAVGLQAIAVCDHNSLRQLPVVAQCCQQRGIHLFYGVEITTQEELHLVALLPNWEACLQMQEYIDTHIMKLPYSPEKLGDQIWVDINEQIAGEVDWYLNAPLKCTLEKMVEAIHNMGGLAIAAHIDRPSYSISSQLGFMPTKLAIDAIEYHRLEAFQKMCLLQAELKQHSFYTASDAHWLNQIGVGRSLLHVEQLNFEELCKAFHQQDGRFIKAEF